MRAEDIAKTLLKNKNNDEYGELAHKINFLGEDGFERHRQERERLLDLIDSLGGETCFRGSKMDCRRLSSGCIKCGEGSWSCLFINGICNAKCFYCPAEQKEAGLPVTNTLEFPEVDEYISYLERFGFKGVSISGGEPLLSFERSSRYIRKIREHFGRAMYIWLYTNGILVDVPKLEHLSESGLDEIRFDLGATGYGTGKLQMAVDIIPVVTVEIPAVPGQYEKVRELLPVMDKLGVKHLNLHQLRITEFNSRHLLKHNYSYLHGNKITVAESEITALRLLADALSMGLKMKVNYCSFVYKNRYQGKATRIRTAGEVCRSWEEITPAGFIRSLWITAPAEIMVNVSEILTRSDPEKKDWYMPEPGNKAFIISHLVSQLRQIPEMELHVRYYDTRFTGSISYRNPYTTINLNNSRKIYIEKMQCFSDYRLTATEKELFLKVISDNGSIAGLEYEMLDKLGIPDEKKRMWIDILKFEQLPYGLQS